MLDFSMAGSHAGALPVDLKVRNRVAVLNVFRDGGTYTANQIADMTGISRQTVMKAIQFFLDRKVLASTGKGVSTEVGGKKPELFAFVYDAPIMSVAMWPDYFVLTLSDLQGRRLGYVRIDTPIPPTVEEALTMFSENAGKLLSDHHFTPQDVFGVTLSAAGVIDSKAGLLKYSLQMPKWGVNVPLRQYMQNFFGEDAVVIVENASRMTGRSALLETGYLSKRVLTLFADWGLSACLIENGHIKSGRNALTGEIGHMVLDPHDTELCVCGGRGCFERLVSIGRIRQYFFNNPLKHKASLLGDVAAEQIRLEDVFRASAQGDVFVRELVRRLARIFALALRNIMLIFEADVVVFQGSYADADEYFSGLLAQSLAEFKYFPRGGAFEVRFDRRPLSELEVIGSSDCLQKAFFNRPGLYVE